MNLIRMILRFQVALLFTYGTVLCIAALYLTGLGHGSYLLLDLAGAPFSLLGIPAGCLACLCQWGLLAILQRRWRNAPLFLAGFLVLHYVTAAIALHTLLYPEDTNFEHLNRMLRGFTLYLSAGLAWYAGGQIVLWIIAFRGISANLMRSGLNSRHG